MKKLLTLAAMAVFAVFLVSGCTMKSSYTPTSATTPALTPQTRFSVAEVIDNSGFTPTGEDLHPGEAMKNALDAALKNEGLSGDDLAIHMTVKKYTPGSAWGRWFFPGLGSTRLFTNSTLTDKNGATVAEIPVERAVHFGGAFTMGEWRAVFDEVANEFVKVLKKEMGLIPKNPQNPDGTKKQN